MIVFGCRRIHKLPFVAISQSGTHTLRNRLILRPITLAHQSRVLVTELIEYFIMLVALRTALHDFLYVPIVYYLFNICHPRTLLSMVLATKRNRALRHLLGVTSLAQIEPIHIRYLLYHYQATVATYELTHI